MGPLADDSLADSLRALHEHYVDAVNRAVAADRYDLVAELVADYPDEALALMAPCPVNKLILHHQFKFLRASVFLQLFVRVHLQFQDQ